jgi:hypothetical protein
VNTVFTMWKIRQTDCYKHFKLNTIMRGGHCQIFFMSSVVLLVPLIIEEIENLCVHAVCSLKDERSVEKHDAKWSCCVLTNSQELYNHTQHSGQVFSNPQPTAPIGWLSINYFNDVIMQYLYYCSSLYHTFLFR